MKWRLMAIAITLIGGNCPAQDLPEASLLKGRFFLYWGYNRAIYSASDIHFTGAEHDFTLRDVQATDRPVDFSADDYLSPIKIWNPQYNFRAGYFFTEHWSLSLGLDHMKYVVTQDQVVTMDGYARATTTGAWETASGTSEVKLAEDFLKYEHTDGLNVLSVDADGYERLWNSPNGSQALHATEGIFLGPVIPRSDVRLFGEGLNNRFHVAGWGAGAQLGLHFTFLRHFFLHTAARGGYIDLPDVLTTGGEEDRASQHFWFAEWYGVLGATIGTGR